MAGRFKLMIRKGSNDVWGWNGFVLDTQTGKRHGLINTVLDYELDGERAYSHCAFDTREEIHRAANRKALILMRAA